MSYDPIDALRRADELLTAGRQHVVEVDIKGCSDAIPHDRLMALVRGHVADGKVLGLIGGFLKQGVMEGAELAKAVEDMPGDEPQGTPQGGVISPLLYCRASRFVIREELEVESQQAFDFGFESVFKAVEALVDGSSESCKVLMVFIGQTFLFREFPHSFNQIEIGTVGRKEQ